MLTPFVRLADRTVSVISATLELFHLYADEAGFTLDVVLDGHDKLALEGRVRAPALPGPSRLVVWYVDAPRLLTLAGAHGTLSAVEPRPELGCLALGSGLAHITGAVALTWTPLVGGATRTHLVDVDLHAALIT